MAAAEKADQKKGKQSDVAAHDAVPEKSKGIVAIMRRARRHFVKQGNTLPALLAKLYGR